MDQLRLWRGLAVDRAIAQGKDVERYRDGTGSVFWWYADLSASNDAARSYGSGSPESAEFLYWELYRDDASTGWIVLGAVFDTTRLSELAVQPFVVHGLQPAGESGHEISFEFASEHMRHAYTCSILVQVSDTGTFVIRSGSVKVTRVDPTDESSETRVIKHVTEDFATNDSVSGKIIDKCCPMCGGTGYATTFAIPKKELQKGRSGYELWSANTVNGAEACIYCGGEGRRFEEWYLDEEPQRRLTSTTYRAGTGRFRARRPPVHGSFGSS